MNIITVTNLCTAVTIIENCLENNEEVLISADRINEKEHIHILVKSNVELAIKGLKKDQLIVNELKVDQALSYLTKSFIQDNILGKR